MSETKIDILAKLPLQQLENLRDTYEARHDRQNVADVREAIGRKGAVQTEELARSGQLFGHRIELDPSGLGDTAGGSIHRRPAGVDVHVHVARRHRPC